jgi:hypothetical protein
MHQLGKLSLRLFIIFILTKTKLTRWKVVLAFDILTELALVGNSVYLVRDLHVPLGKKIVVVLAFALRLP